MSNSIALFDGKGSKDYALVETLLPHYSRYLATISNLVIDYLKGKNNATVVDLGCGPASLLRLMTNVDKSNSFIGVDSSTSFEALANKNCHDKYLFANSDIFEWLKAQKSRSIDVFCTSWVFHNWNIDYRAKVFQEISRVIKVDGLLINADKISLSNESTNNDMLRKQIHLFIKELKDKNSSSMEVWIDHYLADEHENIRFTDAENTMLHKVNGFSQPIILNRDIMDCISVSHLIA